MKYQPIYRSLYSARTISGKFSWQALYTNSSRPEYLLKFYLHPATFALSQAIYDPSCTTNGGV